MKKIFISVLSVLVIAILITVSCKKKQNSGSAITPTYKDEATTTGANPNTTQVTTTGTTATTSSANQNSSITVGGGSWSSVGCTGQTCLSGSNSTTNTNVTICFSSVPSAGTYTLVSSQSALGPGLAYMTITNPPSQPSGSTWHSTGGTVVVTTGATNITAAFSNVSCTQSGSSFPVVTASGQVGCL